MNTLGHYLRLTTFGESHGAMIGGVLDGMPSGIKIDVEWLENEMKRRQGGRNAFTTPRKEDDKVEIVSGVFENFSTGTPIGFLIHNKRPRSKDYENIKNLFRPSHADFTYFHKYGIRDFRGGGRSSARESAIRVAGGAFAKMLLKEIGIVCESGIVEIGGIKAKDYDFDYALKSEIFALDKNQEIAQKEIIQNAKKNHDSIGGVALIRARSLKKDCKLPIGLGEGLYAKLDAKIAEVMMGLNGVKAVEIGKGIESASMHGSSYNDLIHKKGFLSNHSGGILGGMSNGEEIIIKVYFKPTPSIFKPQQTIDIHNNECECLLEGRHDPCIAIRGSVVCESLLALVLADMALLNLGSKIEHLQAIYKGN
ncbi:chorismate synthase [Helicobacter cetorum]|uniref:chorismate synthase n=1 Tax=Helicobacter cetorum TaxID=138563 RepID=UPI000CF0ABE4|nr:chorismate synthase [Helicobacter cetorum]